MTPDGKPLQYGRMCMCSMHCKNRCEVACCGEFAGWCDCWCHAEEYKAKKGKRESNSDDPLLQAERA